MAIFPQLDSVIEAFAQPVTLRRVTHTVSEYGSPAESAADWTTMGSVSNATVEDNQFFQGLITEDAKKVYIRAGAVAKNGSQTKTIAELGVYPSDKIVIAGTTYMIVAVRDYSLECGFYAILIRAVQAGG